MVDVCTMFASCCSVWLCLFRWFIFSFCLNLLGLYVCGIALLVYVDV